MTARAAPGFDIPAPLRALLFGCGAILLGITFYALARGLGGGIPAPDLAQRRAVGFHLLTVIPAVPLGMAMLAMRKGGTKHRWMGRVWMALMAATAASTFFIHAINPRGFSLIHLLSILTLVAVPRAIWAARTGRWAAHRRGTLLLFTLALVVAGGFTFYPGRTMYHWAFDRTPAAAR